jgi:hypothetical protein
VLSRNGLSILPDQIATAWPADRRLPPIGNEPPAIALDAALRAIARRHGTATSQFVAKQLEYQRQ